MIIAKEITYVIVNKIAPTILSAFAIAWIAIETFFR